LLQSPAQLVGATGILCSATDSVYFLDDIINLLSSHQLAYSLEIAIATSKKKHLLDDIILIASHID
jgi:hypothetical protein